MAILISEGREVYIPGTTIYSNMLRFKSRTTPVSQFIFVPLSMRRTQNVAEELPQPPVLAQASAGVGVFS